MPQGDYFILMGFGVVFLLLGLGAYIWGRREQERYDNTLATRTTDLREFMEHWPPRPQPGALKVGSRIAFIIGLLTLITGGILWLLN